MFERANFENYQTDLKMLPPGLKKIDIDLLFLNKNVFLGEIKCNYCKNSIIL